jgi:hypothetical protein
MTPAQRGVHHCQGKCAGMSGVASCDHTADDAKEICNISRAGHSSSCQPATLTLAHAATLPHAGMPPGCEARPWLPWPAGHSMVLAQLAVADDQVAELV